MKKRRWLLIGILILILGLIIFGSGKDKTVNLPEKESLIPTNALKMTPQNDPLPPKLLSEEFTEPVPLPYPVNTKGLEDSAFVMPDGKTLYVWFTPNNGMNVYEQAQDKVTGIYKFEKQNAGWSDPERVWLVKPGEPHLDGCGFFQGNKVWVCGTREGYDGLNWFVSEIEGGNWSIAEHYKFGPDYEVGELHFSNDGHWVYFHSSKDGGMGGRDIWVSEKVNGEWQEPKNLENINSDGDEGWPALNPKEDELWISKEYGLWKSEKIDGEWQTPEKIVLDLASEATIDKEGNVYFTHHYFKNGKMIESDIYVIYRK